MTPIPDATLVVTTKNRKDDLARTLASALTQEARLEIIVIDDASTDGTSDMVVARFPTVRYERSERSLGYIVQRNRAAALSRAPIIFSLDDDAVFSTPAVVRQTLDDFDDPRLGAVAIPYVNVNYSPRLLQAAPSAVDTFVTSSFVGTAHALRRDVFLGLGGYREFLFHQGEESDYAIRMLDHGYVVRLGRADPIYHFESPIRDRPRMDTYGPRNLILFGWHNAPALLLPAQLLSGAAKALGHGLKGKRVGRVTRGLAMGARDAFRSPHSRTPVTTATYVLHKMLARYPLRLGAIADKLPDAADLDQQ